MNKTLKHIILSFVVFAVSAGLGRFFYHNVIVPWPYRHELQECLDAAEILLTDQETDAARDVCFRTYPHVN
jgi:hypothetical protein